MPPRIDELLNCQPLLVTRTPGTPTAATGSRPAMAYPAFATRTPTQSWQLLRRALALELRNVLEKKANEDQLRSTTNLDQLPPDLQALLEFADALQPLSEGTKVRDNTTKLIFTYPHILGNRITCRYISYQYILPHPEYTQLTLPVTI